MPVIVPIQTSFNGGEISPRMRGRMDLPLYHRALALCDNWNPTPQGSLRTRGGLQHISDLVGAPGTNRRLLDFKTASMNRYVLELTDGLLRIYDPTGALALTTGDMVVNGTFETDLSSWTTGAATWLPTSKAARISDGGYIRQGVGTAAINYTLKVSVVGQTSIPGEGVEGARITAGTTAGGADLLDEIVTEKIGHTFTFDGTAGTNYIQVSHAGLLVGSRVDVDTISLKPTASDNSVVAPWTAAQVADVQIAMMTGSDTVYLAHPEVQTRKITLNASTGVWSLTSVAFVGKPAAWTGSNWPGVVEVWQGRLYLAATVAQKSTFWASRPGSVEDFTLGDLAGDGFSYAVATKGKIQWMRGARVMLAGTDDGEFSISAGDGVVYAGNIDIKQESAFGSAPIQALNLGDQVVYVSPDRRRVRAMAFTTEGGGWSSRDISFTAEHITAGRIKDLRFARDPDATLILLLEEGPLVCCNYDRAEQVAAWWTISLREGETSTGQVDAICGVLSALGSEVWAAVGRGTAVTLERIPMYDPEGPVWDAGGRTTVLDANKQITVPVSLNGLTVWVQKNDGSAPIRAGTVVAGLTPAITDLEVADEVTYGLVFTADAETLPVEGGNPAGTSQGFKVHFADISVRLSDSVPPLVNGERAGDGRPFSAPLDAAEPRVSADVKVQNLGVSEGGIITLSQDLPMRTEICAIYGLAQTSRV